MKTEPVTIERKMYRMREISEATGLDRSTIHRLVQSGAIRSTRVGRSVLIPTAAYEQFLADVEAGRLAPSH